MKNIKGLDTLRAFAVFFVIIEHFGVWFDDTSTSGKIIRYILIPDGGFGVDLFFVLSGFLITSILFKARRDAQNNKPLIIIKNFFIRRALRIFPIYYLLLFVLFLVKYPGIKEHMGYYSTYTANFLFYRTNAWNSFSHTWTLDVEEQFYLLWPWLIIFIKERYFKYVAFICIATGIISTYIAIVQGHIAPFLVFNCIDAFAIGGLYAWARLGVAENKKFETIIKRVVVVVALGIYFYWKVTPQFTDYPVYGLFLVKVVNSIIAVWLIILVVNNRSEWVAKYILGNRFLNFIGKISYGIYLYHYVYIVGYCNEVNHLLYQVTLPYPRINKTIHDHHVDYWIQVSAIIIIATLSYKLIEQPLLKFKKKFNYSEKITK